MAKTYQAKLTLQDNWTAVINKAIKETEKLQKQFDKIKQAKAEPKITPKIDANAMRAFNSDIARMSRSRINIGARMDASVHSTLNAINSRIVPNRVIRISARDDVTRTVTNLQRNIFTMQSAMNVGLRNPFGNMSLSARLAQGNLSSLLTGVGALGAASRAAAVASSAAAMAAAGGAGAIVAGGRTRTAPVILPPRTPEIPPAIFGPGRPTIFQSIRAALQDGRNRLMAHQSGDITGSDEFRGTGVRAWESNSNFAQLIGRQRMAMGARGIHNYLPQYQNTSVVTNQSPLGPEYSDTIEAMTVQNGRMRQSALNMWDSISQRGTQVMNRLRSGYTSVATHANNAFNSIRSSRLVQGAQTAAMRMQFAFQRGAYHATSALQSIVMGASNAFNRLPEPVQRAMTRIRSSISSVAGRTWNIAVGVVDRATSALKKMAGMLASMGKGIVIGVAVAGAAAVKAAVTGAMDLEAQKVAMKHTMGFADAQKNNGKGSMTSAELSKATDDYIKGLRVLADKTPFGTGDIISAGSRAMSVMDGDAAGAMDLTKISTDMAALNPGKTPLDAMEALADAKMGEFERLKEFGIKVSQKDFKTSIGKGENDNLTPEETNKAYAKLMNDKLKPRFGGGADALSGTAKGLLSTITGNIGSSLTDIGTMFLPQIKTGLQGVLDFMSTATPKVMDFFAVLSGNKMADSPGMQKVFNVFQKVGVVVGQVGDIVKTVVKAMTPTFEYLGGLVGRIMETVAGKIGVVTKIIGYLGEIWQGIWPTIQSVLETAWGIIEPIFNTLMSTASIIADIFMIVWPGIKGAIELLWAAIQPIFELMGSALEKISQFAGWVADKLDGVVNKNDKVKAAGDEADKNSGDSRAVGMAYIPYNGFKASLHRGEAILTRQDADNWREGKSVTNKAPMKIDIHINGTGDPDLVAQKVHDKLVQTAANM